MRVVKDIALWVLTCVLFAALGYGLRMYHEGGITPKMAAVWDTLASHDVRIGGLERGVVIPQTGKGKVGR